MVRDFKVEGYPQEEPLIPHGYSVILNAPSVFRFTADACPERHLDAAKCLGADVSDVALKDAGEVSHQLHNGDYWFFFVCLPFCLVSRIRRMLTGLNSYWQRE